MLQRFGVETNRFGLSTGTLTGWEYRFSAECDVENFRVVMQAAVEACGSFQMQG